MGIVISGRGLTTYGPRAVTSDGLVLYFDAHNSRSGGNAVTWYDMIGGYTLTMYGSPTYNTSGYYSFTGSSQYAYSTNIASCNFYNTGTVEIWSQITDYSNFYYAPLINQGASAGWDTDGWGIESWTNPNNQVYGWLHNHAGGIILSAYFGNETSLGYGFNQYTLTYSRTYIGAYLNGVLIQGYSFSDCQPCGNDMIGQPMRVTSTYGPPFGQNVGAIKAYNRLLSQDEVTQNYNALKARYGLT